MANKNTGIDRKNAGSRMDEQVVGRESTSLDRGDEYGSPDTSGALPRTSNDTTMDDSTRQANPQGRTREIRAEIEQTREEMSETVNTIQERLRPGRIASDAVDSVREKATEGAREIAESEPVRYARANAIPTAMVGLGLAGAAWLAFGSRRPVRSRSRSRGERYAAWEARPYNYDESDEYYVDNPYVGRVPNTGARTSADLTRGTSSAEYGREGMGRTQNPRESTTEYAREGMVRAQNQLQQTWDRNPLLMGTAAGILGAIIGSLVPETERENELMGSARDSMVEGVEQAVQNKVEQVQNAATNAVNEVQKAVGITVTDESKSSTASTASTPATPSASATPSTSSNPPSGSGGQQPRKTGSTS